MHQWLTLVKPFKIRQTSNGSVLRRFAGCLFSADCTTNIDWKELPAEGRSGNSAVSSTPALSASFFGPLCDRACSQIEISFRAQCRFLARLTDSHISNADGSFAYRNRRSQDNLKIYGLVMTYTSRLLRS